MFNIGPLEFVVLAIVAVVVLGPDRLPSLARDAARMLKTLRELATGARTQLREELGPEFADLDLRNLNPRTALSRAILGDEETGMGAELRKLDPREDFQDLDPRTSFRDALRPNPPTGADPLDHRVQADVDEPVSMSKPVERPLARDERAPFDDDAT